MMIVRSSLVWSVVVKLGRPVKYDNPGTPIISIPLLHPHLHIPLWSLSICLYAVCLFAFPTSCSVVHSLLSTGFENAELIAHHRHIMSMILPTR